MNKAFKRLIKRYADGRPICNCGDAYYSPCGDGVDGQGTRRTDMLVCQNGCSTNLIVAKEYVAEMVEKEFISPLAT